MSTRRRQPCTWSNTDNSDPAPPRSHYSTSTKLQFKPNRGTATCYAKTFSIHHERDGQDLVSDPVLGFLACTLTFVLVSISISRRKRGYLSRALYRPLSAAAALTFAALSPLRSARTSIPLGPRPRHIILQELEVLPALSTPLRLKAVEQSGRGRPPPPGAGVGWRGGSGSR